jgi:signal peptidase II
LLDDLVRFERSQNEGAILGLGAGLPQSLRLLLAIALNGATLVIALSLAIDPRDLNGLQVSGIALLAGGGTSNLVDRLYNDGAVFDFVRLGRGWARTGIFNLADVAIVVGVLMVLVFSFTSSPREAQG